MAEQAAEAQQQQAAPEGQQQAPDQQAQEPAAQAAEPAPAAEQPDYWARVTELEAHSRALSEENRQLKTRSQAPTGPDAFKSWAAENPTEAIDLVLSSMPDPATQRGAPGGNTATAVDLPPELVQRLERVEKLEAEFGRLSERSEMADFKEAVSGSPEKYAMYRTSPKRLQLAFQAYRQSGLSAQGVTVDQWLEASHQAQMDELRSELSQVREAKLFPDLFGATPPAAAATNASSPDTSRRGGSAPAIGAGSGDTPAQRDDMSDEEIIKLAARRMQGLE